MDLVTVQNLDGIQEVLEKKPVTFIHGDNMALLRWMKEEMMMGYFHVGIVDPPYGISVGGMNLGQTKNSKPRNFAMGKWDNAVPTQEYWDLLRYVCRKLIVWGGNYFTKELCWSGRAFIVWDKMNHGMSFADCEIALTDFDENARVIKRTRTAKTDDEEEKRHPTQKPVYLYDYTHLNFVEKNQRVLDTHGGSFNHAIAAIKNNVQLTIIEREKSYFDSGVAACDNRLTKGGLLF